MNIDFTQLYSSMVYFKEDMKIRWNLDEYHDISSPAVFLGLYENKDIVALTNHKGPKILIWGGGDMTPDRLQYVADLQKQSSLYSWAYPGEFSKILSSYDIDHKQLFIQIKDYSMYTPCELGENIYVYKGIHGNRHDHFKWNDIVVPLIKVFGEDRVLFSNHLSTNELIESVYKNCFVYIKPNPVGGCTTMWELGHMGRRTLGASNMCVDIFSEYRDIYHLIDLIMEESKYIGKMRYDISNLTKSIFTDQEWLTMEFWNG